MLVERPLPPTPVLETERLILRPIALRDAAAIQAHFPDWELVKHLHAGIPWPSPADGAEASVRQALEETARGVRFHWAITLKDGDDELIGRIDLWPFDGVTRDMRGFYLARAYWGRGLITEAAEAVTDYALRVLEWPFLYLTNAEVNLASHRVKAKQGATLIAREPAAYMAGEFLREVWLLTREDWLERR
jgi:RimJ/RimL family protein N-acetyltransferase